LHPKLIYTLKVDLYNNVT